MGIFGFMYRAVQTGIKTFIHEQLNIMDQYRNSTLCSPILDCHLQVPIHQSLDDRFRNGVYSLQAHTHKKYQIFILKNQLYMKESKRNAMNLIKD